MGKSVTYCVSIHSEDILVERRVDTNDIPHLVVDLELEGRHRSVEVHTVEILHEKDLTVTLATVTRLGALRRLSDLDNNDVPTGVRCQL